MRGRKSSYTEEDEKAILKAINNNLGNLQQAFREVAPTINRTPYGVQYYWYYILSKKPKAKVFFSLGRKKTYINRKIVVDDSTMVRTKVSIFNKIKKLLGL